MKIMSLIIQVGKNFNMKQFLIFLISVLLISCAEKPSLQLQEFKGEALGTGYMVKFYSEKNIDFEKAMDSMISDINHSMSTYISDSDISRINDGDTTVVVDDHFKTVFKASNKVFKESGGYFDPTVGVLVNAYGFGPENKLNEIDKEQLDSLRELVGFEKLRLTETSTIQKQNEHIYLDFNAIAKGYMIDVIGNYLEENSIKNYLVELGGELRARGKNLDSQSPWIVGIDDPSQLTGERSLFAKIKLENRAMATSGNYRKFRIDSATGERFVHTINPLSGKAERSNLLSASVLAENCMLADAYATAFMSLGLEKSREMLRELEGVEVYLIYSGINDTTEVYISSGFIEQIVE